MAFESMLIVLHNVSYWKRCSPSSFIDSGFILSFPPLSATAPLISTTWPPVRWTVLCTFRTPAAGRSSRWNRCALWKMWPRIWSWWQGLVTSASRMMTLAVGMEERLLRPLSLTREVLYGCYCNQCSVWFQVSKRSWRFIFFFFK